MARNNDLSKMFPDAKGCTTKAGAQRRVTKVQGALEAHDVTHVVVEREDGTFLPVAFLRDRNSFLLRGLIDAGFGVTN